MPTPATRALLAAARLVPDAAVALAFTRPPRLRPRVPRRISQRYDVTQALVEGHPVVTARPRTGGVGQHLVHLHGGAYTLQHQHWPFLARWLERGWTVTLVDYPLAPEHTVETTVPVTVAAWEHVVAEAAVHSPGTPVHLAGDSAGGGLALVLLQQLRDAGRPLPRRTVLLSPWVDLVMDDAATIAAAADDVLLSLPGLRGAAALYAGDRPLTDPWLSPIHGGLHDLGEVQAWVGTAEMFEPQDRRLADLAASAPGTDLTLHLGHGLPHDWLLFPTPEREWLVEEMQAFLERA